MITDRILDNLNPPQQEAVLHGDGPLLVFAGAIGVGERAPFDTHVVERRDLRGAERGDLLRRQPPRGQPVQRADQRDGHRGRRARRSADRRLGENGDLDGHFLGLQYKFLFSHGVEYDRLHEKR